MKRTVIMTLIAALLMVSCGSERSIANAFEKRGYTMGEMTPEQQAETAPQLSEFPRYDAVACGFLKSRNSATFVYPLDEALWAEYCVTLSRSGFDCFEIGFSKADYSKECTYNVSSRILELYGKRLLLVTFAVVSL